MTSAPPSSSPIFVVGVAHSGTTILHRMLAYHPGVTWFSQFSLRTGEIEGRPRRSGADLADRLLRSIPHRWQKQKPRFGRPPLTPRPSEAQAIWAHLLNQGQEFPSVEELAEVEPRSPAPVDLERLRAGVVRFSERFKQRGLLAKLPAPDFYRYLEPVQAALPSTLFVHIVRDGRPVAFSLRSKFERKLERAEALRAAARHWANSLERVHAARDVELLEIRYEDLCDDVYGVIREVLARAGLDADSFAFERCPAQLSQTNPRWIRQATDQELGELTDIQREPLERFGYQLALREAAGGAVVR